METLFSGEAVGEIDDEEDEEVESSKVNEDKVLFSALMYMEWIIFDSDEKGEKIEIEEMYNEIYNKETFREACMGMGTLQSMDKSEKKEYFTLLKDAMFQIEGKDELTPTDILSDILTLSGREDLLKRNGL